MATKPESRITLAIINAIKRRGYWARKVHGGTFTGAGIPDVDAVVRGLSVRIEVKRPGEKPTEIQKAVMAELERAGAYVTVATSVDEAIEFVDFVAATRV